jgi:hypothetical protein
VVIHGPFVLLGSLLRLLKLAANREPQVIELYDLLRFILELFGI